MLILRQVCIGMGLLSALLVPGASHALSINFDVDGSGVPIVHGDVLDDQYSVLGVHLSADNPNRAFDIAVAFNTNANGTADADLEAPFAGGNLVGTDLGNVMIISENPAGSQPDDEGNRPAGTLIVDLDFQASALGLDVLDIDSVTAEGGGIDFFLEGTLVGSFDWVDLVTAASGLFDASIVFGDHSANRIASIALSDLEGSDGSAFDRFVIRMGGSGAVDNLEITEVVPEPSAALLVACAGMLLALRRLRIA
jgi:hypothetical protein